MNVDQPSTRNAIKRSAQQSVPIRVLSETGQHPDHQHKVEFAQISLVQKIAFNEVCFHVRDFGRASRLRNCFPINIDPQYVEATASQPHGCLSTAAANFER